MKSKAISMTLVLMAAGLINAGEGKIVYHPEYAIKAGKAVSGYLNTSHLIFTPARAVASKLGRENEFLDKFPFRAYVDLSRPENAKKLIDEFVEDTKGAYHIVKSEIPQDMLRKVHSDLHVKELLEDPRVIATIGEMDFLADMYTYWPRLRKLEESMDEGWKKTFVSWLRSKLEGFTPEFFRKKVVRPFLLQAQGTLDAVDIVLGGKKGYSWAINLGGGFHHAKTEPTGSTIQERLDDYKNWGNCSVSDQGLAALYAHEKYGIDKVLLVDLDAHQGNGNARVFKWLRDKFPKLNAQIFDMYNSESSGNYPPDQEDVVKAGLIKYGYALKRWVNGKIYLNTLKRELPKAIKEMRPELLIYNAGTDPLMGDPEGCLSLTKKEMIKRDEIVFNQAKQHDIPIISNTSGGYTKDCAPLIAASVKNLKEKGIIDLK